MSSISSGESRCLFPSCFDAAPASNSDVVAELIAGLKLPGLRALFNATLLGV